MSDTHSVLWSVTWYNFCTSPYMWQGRVSLQTTLPLSSSFFHVFLLVLCHSSYHLYTHRIVPLSPPPLVDRVRLPRSLITIERKMGSTIVSRTLIFRSRATNSLYFNTNPNSHKILSLLRWQEWLYKNKFTKQKIPFYVQIYRSSLWIMFFPFSCYIFSVLVVNPVPNP